MMNAEKFKIERNKYVDFIGKEFIENNTLLRVKIYAVNMASWTNVNNEKEDLLCFFLEYPIELNRNPQNVPVESFHRLYKKIS